MPRKLSDNPDAVRRRNWYNSLTKEKRDELKRKMREYYKTRRQDFTARKARWREARRREAKAVPDSA